MLTAGAAASGPISEMQASTTPIWVSIDTGGTFTDVLVARGGALVTGKAPTTRHNLTEGVLAALQDAAAALGLTIDDLLAGAALVRYATTVGTNCLVERTGPRLGLITTRGFEATLHFGRSHNWADGLPRAVRVDRARARRPPPLIPRERIVGVQERVDRYGRVIMPLRDDDASGAIRELVAQGVEGFVVCLLWSFMNPVHERRIRELIREAFPQEYLGAVPVLLSSETDPRQDEYRRTVTTTLDAYLGADQEMHLLELSQVLRRRGYRYPVMMVRNTGGVASISRTRPVQLFGAGPAAGVLGSAYLARRYGLPNVLFTDMGGTSFDLGLIRDGRPADEEVDPVVDRWRVHLPVIAHVSIGAGGGSIAHIDAMGRLAVGPVSAGAYPGPAAYGRGGQLPTVTDADLLLGYIDPARFLGGRLSLRRDAALQAVARSVGKPLGLAPEDAAFQIRRWIDSVMGQEIFKETAIRGYDPREFVIFACGGAGPLHACSFAEHAGISRLMVFPFGSVFNAFGAATTDILQSYERTVHLTLFDALSGAYRDVMGLFNQAVEELLAVARRDLAEEGFADGDTVLRLRIDLRYVGQNRGLLVDSPRLALEDAGDVRRVCDAFRRSYAAQYSQAAVFDRGGIVATLLRVEVVRALPELPLAPQAAVTAGLAPAPSRRRSVGWTVGAAGVEFSPTAVYDVAALRPGHRISGPALVDTAQSVWAVAPGWDLSIDSYGAGVLSKEA